MDFHLIGAGHIAEKFVKRNPDLDFMVYDNNKDLQGTLFFGNTVNPVQHIASQKEGVILICTTSITEIKSQLNEISTSLKITVPPELAEFEVQHKLLEKNGRFLIASGLPSNNLHGASGGLFSIDINHSEIQINTVLSGPCHSVVKHKGCFFVTVQEEGIIQLDEKFNIVDKFELKTGLRPHGLCVDDFNFYVVASNSDSVLQISRENLATKRFNLSEKFKDFGSAQHHANDLEIIGDYAYVSMFSTSGNWKRGIYDGGLIEINLKTGNKREICLDLKLPHSVRCVDGSLIVLNSFIGELESFGRFPSLGFNGFLRGFDYDDEYFYMAESRNRNSTGLKRKTLPSSIDSRLVIVDRSAYYSRTISLPQYISEIHSVLAL